jgi:hypothetical protein
MTDCPTLTNFLYRKILYFYLFLSEPEAHLDLYRRFPFPYYLQSHKIFYELKVESILSFMASYDFSSLWAPGMVDA